MNLHKEKHMIQFIVSMGISLVTFMFLAIYCWDIYFLCMLVYALGGISAISFTYNKL